MLKSLLPPRSIPVLHPHARTFSTSRSSPAAPPPPLRLPPPTLNTFRYFVPYNTRWSDNDMYGHLNNPQYIHYVDAAVNEYMITHCALNPLSQTAPIALAVSSSFSYSAPLAYPEPLLAAISIDKLGKSSVNWRVGLFGVDSEKGEGVGRYLRESSGGSTESKEGQGGVPNLEGRVGGSLGDLQRVAVCHGSFVHVFVDPVSRKAVEIPTKVREGLEKILVKVKESGEVV